MIFNITETDKAYERFSSQKWDTVAKPIDGLGKLEKLINKIAAIRQTTQISLDKRAMLIFCSDNGVVAEGVTQTDSSITRLVTENIVLGRATISALAKAAGAQTFAIDVGIIGKTPSGAMNLKVANGTKNIAMCAAMTREECAKAIDCGRKAILAHSDCDIIGIGEMGIGNTTTASAVASVLLDIPPEKAVGRGAGLSSARLAHKIEVVKRAIALNKPDKNDAADVLARLGGFDICAMAGAYIGAAENHIPIICDGAIGLCAAYAAQMLAPNVTDYILPSHLGKEPICREICTRLGFEPVITADMALGEGSGAVMLLPLLDMALTIYNNATFDELAMTAYKREK